MVLNKSKIDIVFVEDNETMRDELIDFLKMQGFSIAGINDGPELNEFLKTHQPEILILDLNLQFEDGISITKRIRLAYPDIRIVLLTGRVMLVNRIEGYEAGADVYLTKPTRPAEIVAVIRNLQKRYKTSHVEEQLCTLDTLAFQLTCTGCEPIALTSGEVMLLQAMAVSNRYLTHHDLMTFFGDAVLDEKTKKARLEVLISRLRLKLRSHERQNLDIKALRGEGYRLTFNLRIKDGLKATKD
jgi:DNA-binding response OmpR family regulator